MFSLIEVSLQVLIGVVDEKLLEAVGVELLESIDVQDTDETPHLAVTNRIESNRGNNRGSAPTINTGDPISYPLP